MRYTSSDGPLEPDGFAALAVPVLADGTVPEAALRALGPAGAAAAALAARLAPHVLGAHAWVAPAAGGPDVLLVGVGAADLGALRTAAMAAGRVADRPRVASLLAAAYASADAAAATAVAEGWALGAYRFDAYRSRATASRAEEVVLVGGDPDAVALGAALGEAAGVTRDLVNTPPGDLPPLALADRCRELGAVHGFTVRVREGRELAQGGFGGLLAVGAGSANPPALIELERGRPEDPHIALVGKGITFDAGGLSIKTNLEMQTMKADMAGAAAVIGAFVAADRLGLDTHLRGYLACAENLPSGSAFRVGDVLRHRNGLTTEVVDTDCEGRLVLADVLAYTAEAAPSLIVDLATLSSQTGLGPRMWAGLGTDRAAVARLVAAGAASGEPGWELPLHEGYLDHLRSGVADLRNRDPAFAYAPGAVLAGLYLRHFVADVPWAHMDLGISVMRPRGDRAWAEGANGTGARTLARFLLDAAAAGRDSGSADQTAGNNSSGPTIR
ncbi:putative cytosol aminopeptidase [Baekduia alba]|uniref:leucyl aminopeptidase family protein n=1 Tax=Baekduia alba TaxID=2997333 RepID=UPI0023420353|nr:leucyl aminopeptidase family protein [Baekduia alba]WCB95155.1 putative cytosol aminopeptidase [Baekduia alba]